MFYKRRSKGKFMKKIVSMLVLLCMALNFYFFTPAQNIALKDIENDAQLKEAVETLIKYGIINGYEDGTFRPQNGLTRAQFCKIVNLTFGYKEKAADGFSDVGTEDWFYDQVLIAKKAGYIAGFEDGTFRGNNFVTRQQVCVILNRILGLYKLSDVNISDEVSDWAKDAVMNVISNGFMSVESGNTFRATHIILRSEVAMLFAPIAKANSEIPDKDKDNEGKKDDNNPPSPPSPVTPEETGTYNTTYYQQNVGGTGYTVVKTLNTKKVKAGTKVTADILPFEGFTYNSSKSVTSLTVAKGELSELKVYYDRNKYTVRFINGSDVVEEKSLLYGQTIPDVAAPQKEGYKFDGWYYGDKKIDSESVVTSDMTINAKFTLVPADEAVYTVNHYKQNVQDDKYTLSDSEKFTAKAGSTIKAAAKAYNNFHVVTADLTGVVAKDGSLAINIYYDRDILTVTFISDGSSSDYKVKYEAAYPSVPVPKKENFKFDGWYCGDEIVDTDGIVTKNITLTAKFSVINAKYTVNYYTQNINDDEYTLYKTEVLYADAGQKVTVSVESDSNYKCISDTSGIVKADGSLVIDIKFDRTVYTVSFISDGSVFKKQNIRYGGIVPFAESPSKEGYTFDGWFDENGNEYFAGTDVTSDITYTAKFTKKGTPEDLSKDDEAVEALSRFYENVKGVRFANEKNTIMKNVKSVILKVISDSETKLITTEYVKTQYKSQIDEARAAYNSMDEKTKNEFESEIIGYVGSDYDVLYEYFFGD